MGANITEPRQALIQPNAVLEAKPVFSVAWRGGETIRQKGRLEGRAVCVTRISRTSEASEGRGVFRYREEETVWRFEEPDTDRDGGRGNSNTRRDGRKPA
jgi:hypothetical protein